MCIIYRDYENVGLGFHIYEGLGVGKGSKWVVYDLLKRFGKLVGGV
jgi:hypothetical protein